ncbi:MAG: FAD-dependent oxidoreductase, partial [Planctomycetaceae bacterium]
MLLRVFVVLALPILTASLTYAEDRTDADYDVVVYGGTSSGAVAAIQTANMGRSVVLIEPSQHVGGLTSGGLGATDIGNKAAIGGLSREFYRRVRRWYEDEAHWTREKQSDYQSSRQQGKEDTMWTFEPHVAE